LSTYRFAGEPGTRQVNCLIHPAPTSELNAFRLRQAWESSDFATCHLFPERIEPALRDALDALTAATRDGATTAQADPDAAAPLASFVIAERRDARASVAVSDDGMHAEVTALTAQGGRLLDREMLDAALADAGVRFGTDATQIDQFLADAASAAPGSTLRRSIAQGRVPARGVPSRFENLVVPFQERVLRPQERDDGRVDLLDLGRIESVAAGDALVRRHPAHAGECGKSVHGTEIPAEVPAETPFAIGEGTTVDAQDPHLLRATRTGVPHRLVDGMSVNEVLELPAVDLHTGRIDFDGSLVVKGDVHPDMEVRVTGDLVVAGFIESADVEAGGDVSARKGIIGPPAMGTAHSCRVRGRNIRTHYVQNAQLEADELVVLDTMLVNSVVLRCRSVRAGGEHPRNSRIVGGEIHARESVSAAIIGAETGSATRLVFDDAIRDLRESIEARHARREQLQETGAGLETSLRELAHKPRTEAVDGMLGRIANTIAACREELAALEAEDAATRQRIAELVAGCRVSATVRIHGGVELVCLEARHRFGTDRGPGALEVRDGHWVGSDEEPAA
jgi:hypothetical protein